MEEDAQKKINNIYAEMEAELAKLQKKIKKESKENTSELTAILRARQKVELVKVTLFIEMLEEAIENGMSVVGPPPFSDMPDTRMTTMSDDKPGLWENIRKKKDREGKHYKPAKPGDPDRPDPKSWKKAQS